MITKKTSRYMSTRTWAQISGSISSRRCVYRKHLLLKSPFPFLVSVRRSTTGSFTTPVCMYVCMYVMLCNVKTDILNHTWMYYADIINIQYSSSVHLYIYVCMYVRMYVLYVCTKDEYITYAQSYFMFLTPFPQNFLTSLTVCRALYMKSKR